MDVIVIPTVKCVCHQCALMKLGNNCRAVMWMCKTQGEMALCQNPCIASPLYVPTFTWGHEFVVCLLVSMLACNPYPIAFEWPEVFYLPKSGNLENFCCIHLSWLLHPLFLRVFWVSYHPQFWKFSYRQWFSFSGNYHQLSAPGFDYF